MDIKSQWMCIIYLRLFHKALQKGFLTWFFFYYYEKTLLILALLT